MSNETEGCCPRELIRQIVRDELERAGFDVTGKKRKRQAKANGKPRKVSAYNIHMKECMNDTGVKADFPKAKNRMSQCAARWREKKARGKV